MFVIDIQSNIQIKYSNLITRSKINCIEFIQSNKKFNSIGENNQLLKLNENKPIRKSVESLLDYNSSDEDFQDQLSFHCYSNDSFDSDQDDTIWMGTDQGG